MLESKLPVVRGPLRVAVFLPITLRIGRSPQGDRTNQVNLVLARKHRSLRYKSCDKDPHTLSIDPYGTICPILRGVG